MIKVALSLMRVRFKRKPDRRNRRTGLLQGRKKGCTAFPSTLLHPEAVFRELAPDVSQLQAKRQSPPPGCAPATYTHSLVPF